MTENLALAVRYAFDVAFKATILFTVTTAALFALRRKSAAVRQLVAALGLAGVLALPAASLFAPRWEIPLVPNPVPLAKPPARAPVAPAETWKTSRVDEFSIASDDRASVPDSEALPLGNDLASNPSGKYFEPDGSAAKTSSSPTWWMFGTLALWSAGTLIASTRLVLGAKRVAGIRRRASEVGENWTALSNELARKLGLTRPVRLLFSGDVAVPVTAGLRRPVILLPETARRWNEERRQVVLLHELAHVRRRDWMALLVGQAAAALYWFHPLAWSIRVQMQKDCERACDDLVLASGTRASAYAAHLLSIIRSLRISRQRSLTAVAMAHRSYWDGRMRAILDPAVARRVVSGREARLAAAGLVIAVALLAVFEPWAPDCAQAVAIDHMPYSSSDPGVSGGKLEAPCPNRKKAKVSTTADTRTQEPSFFHADSSITPSPQATTAASSLASEIASEIAAGIAAGEPGGFARAGWKERRSSGQWFSRGMEFHNAKRYDDAIGAFGHSIEEGYRVDTSMYNIACGYARKGDASRAVEWLRKSLKEGFDLASHIDKDDDLDGIRSDPGFVELRRNLRAEKIEASRNRADRLVLRFVELQDAHSTKGSAFYAIGKELLDVGRYDVAAQAFQASAARGYREGASLYNTACALSLGENRAAALDYLQKALDAGFDDVGLLRKDDDLDNVRGEARYTDLLRMAENLELHGSDRDFIKSRTQSGRRFAWREKEKHSVEYTQRHPESGRAWFNLGYTRLEGDRPEAAIEALQRALDLHYRVPTTMYNLACAYSLMDRKDEAFAWLFKALDAGFHSSGMLRSDDDLDNLRGDPRYRQALVRARNLDGDD
jgi:beta-lactamase regulating signal transducer with metallopeptidase domain/tetratricopeptide (TPR) repeat protein